ncbi:hypothetical protein PG999_007345 [Apiospora kogelbergensis]|uniref:Uncharacterized protein n=1 Tax=Apiospora kogelbergensis TaxID=1337665 RepID=A0AAW0QY10_9PEZI
MARAPAALPLRLQASQSNNDNDDDDDDDDDDEDDDDGGGGGGNSSRLHDKVATSGISFLPFYLVNTRFKEDFTPAPASHQVSHIAHQHQQQQQHACPCRLRPCLLLSLRSTVEGQEEDEEEASSADKDRIIIDDRITKEMIEALANVSDPITEADLQLVPQGPKRARSITSSATVVGDDP